MKKIKRFLLIFLTLFLTCCNSIPHFDIDPSLDYSSFEEYYLDSINNLYKKEEVTYGVYLYRVDCPTCEENKNALLNHLNEYKNGNKHFKVYLYNTVRLRSENATYIDKMMSVEETKEAMINKNISTLEDTIINSVPSLYVVNNGVLYDYIAGGVEVAEFLINTNLDSRRYEEINNSFFSSIEEFYTFDYKKYYIYLYFEACPHCFKIKPNIISYLESEKAKEVPLFTFNIYSSNSEEGENIRNKFKVPLNVSSTDEFKKYIEENIENKVNKIEDTYFRYVPSLYEIKDNVYSNCFVGENEIITFLG